MTPGQAALQEAARLETAAVYGRVTVEHKQPRSTPATVAEAILTERADRLAAVEAAIRAGLTTAQVIDAWSVDYETVRAARKRVMRTVAA